MTLSPFILTSFFICSENLLFNTSNFKSNNWKMWNCFSRNIFFLVGNTIFREWISKFVKILCLVPDRDSWEFSNVTYQFLAIKVHTTFQIYNLTISPLNFVANFCRKGNCCNHIRNCTMCNPLDCWLIQSCNWLIFDICNSKNLLNAFEAWSDEAYFLEYVSEV